MPRPKGQGKLRKVGALWVADYTDASGKRRRVSFGTRKADAEKQLREVVNHRDLLTKAGGGGMARHLSVIDQFEAYWLDVGSRCSKSALSTAKLTLNDFQKTMRVRRLGEVTPAVVEQYRIEKLKTLAPTSVRQRLSVLRAFFTYLGRIGYTGPNPVAGVSLPAATPTKTQGRALTDDEVTRLFAAMEAAPERTKRRRPLEVLFLLDTGCRHSEARRLHWEDVDLATATVLFRQTKNGHQRLLPLSARLSTKLEKEAPRRGLVFPTAGGKEQPDSNELRDWLKRRFTEAGIELRTRGGSAHVHALRHTFLTNLARAGVSLAQAQYLSGHRTPGILLGIYTHLGVNDVREGLERAIPGKYPAGRSGVGPN